MNNGRLWREPAGRPQKQLEKRNLLTKKKKKQAKQEIILNLRAELWR